MGDIEGYYGVSVNIRRKGKKEKRDSKYEKQIKREKSCDHVD